MDLGLRGQTALVTAASKGLGKAIAHAFLREEAQVAICSRNPRTLAAAAAEMSPDVLAIPADVTKPEDVQRLARAVVGRFGRIDILVTNAGGPPSGPFIETTEEDWQSARVGSRSGAVAIQ